MKKFYVGIKAIVRDKDRGVILLRREGKKGTFWEVPGGRINEDETFEQAIRRELDEELPGTRVHKVGNLQGAFRLGFDVDEHTGLVLLYFEVEAELPKEVVLSDEHTGFVWLNTSKDIPEPGPNEELSNILQKIL